MEVGQCLGRPEQGVDGSDTYLQRERTEPCHREPPSRRARGRAAAHVEEVEGDERATDKDDGAVGQLQVDEPAGCSASETDRPRRARRLGAAVYDERPGDKDEEQPDDRCPGEAGGAAQHRQGSLGVREGRDGRHGHHPEEEQSDSQVESDGDRCVVRDDGDRPESHLNGDDPDACERGPAHETSLRSGTAGENREPDDEHGDDRHEVAMGLLHQGVELVDGTDAPRAERPALAAHAGSGDPDRAAEDDEEVGRDESRQCQQAHSLHCANPVPATLAAVRPAGLPSVHASDCYTLCGRDVNTNCQLAASSSPSVVVCRLVNDARKQVACVVYRGSSAMLQLLPRSVVLRLGSRAGQLLAAVSPRRRAVVAGNLRHVVGPTASDADLARLVRRSFASYGRYWTESALLVAKNKGLFAAETDIVGRTHLDEAIARGRGVILTLPHVGSWDVGGVYLVEQGIALTGVAEVVEPPELFAWFVARRAALGLTALPLGGGAAAQLLRELRRGGVVALLADRDILGGGVDVELFGARTRLPGGPALLALRSGAALLPCAVYQRPRGRYEMVVRPAVDASRSGRLRDDTAILTQAVAHELEELIRPAPEQWHVFQPNWTADAGELASRSARSVAPRHLATSLAYGRAGRMAP